MAHERGYVGERLAILKELLVGVERIFCGGFVFFREATHFLEFGYEIVLDLVVGQVSEARR